MIETEDFSELTEQLKTLPLENRLRAMFWIDAVKLFKNDDSAANSWTNKMVERTMRTIDKWQNDINE
jgi:hypothetical protein